MLAGVFEGPGQFVTRTLPVPDCPEGGLRLAVAACAVCGTDVKIVNHGHPLVAPPQVLGHEVVGIVEASRCGVPVGARVTVAPAVGCGACRACRAGRPNRCPGLRTIGYQWAGAFAEYLAVPAEAVAQGSICDVPATVDDLSAALAEPLACCLNGQELLGVGDGDRVVVVGLGPIGCLHARLARARGAARVLLVDSRRERGEQARRLQLGEVLDTAARPVGDAIREATDGEGADVVVLAAPVAGLQVEALGWLARGGRLSWFAGLPSGSPEIALASNRVHYEELLIVGAHGSTPAQNRQALALIADGRVPVADLVTASLPLAEAPAAIAVMARSEGLKSVVTVNAAA